LFVILTATRQECLAQRTFRILFTEAAITGGFLGALEKLQKATVSVVMSVCHFVRSLAWINTAPAGKHFRGILHCRVLLQSVEKFQVCLTERKDTDFRTFMTNLV
jgi:hypothetical protein